jgi:hypothetical protein
MEKSTSIKNIAAALITFHVKCDKVGKDATNPFFKKKYASLSNILDTINDPLNESGLAFVQFPTGIDGLTTILIHAASGEYIQECYEMKSAKDDPQSRGSAITYQRRYALAAILGLNIDDDDDANAASRPAEAKQPAQVNGNKSATVETGPELPWLNKGPQYAAVIKRLQEGTTDIKTVKQHYRINKEMMANLEAAMKKENLLEEVPF